MSILNVWVHAIWSVEGRKAVLDPELMVLLYRHVMENGADRGIEIDCLGGSLDHLHCLFRLRHEQCISWVMRMIKGESSRWINRQKLLPQHFTWAEEYMAVSIGRSQVGSTRNHILCQEDYHRRYSYSQELNEMMARYALENFG